MIHNEYEDKVTVGRKERIVSKHTGREEKSGNVRGNDNKMTVYVWVLLLYVDLNLW